MKPLQIPPGRQLLSRLLLTLLLGTGLCQAPVLAQPAPVSEQIAIKRDLASLYRSQNQPQKALQILQEALTLGESAAIRLELGITYFQLGDQPAARLQLTQTAELLRLAPNDQLLESLAYTEKTVNLLPQAAGHYRQLLDHQAHRPELWLQLGHVQALQNQLDDARASYLQALAAYNQQGLPLPAELAFALRATGANDQAEALFVALLTNDPANPAYRLELATLRLQSEPASARTLLEPVQIAGLTADQLRLLAADWLALKQPARAVTALEPLLTTGDQLVLLDYADALRLSGKPATEAYLRVFTSKPSLPTERLRSLAYGLNQSGKPAEALATLERLPVLLASDWLQKALALQALGRRSEAIIAWRQASADQTLLPDAIYNLVSLQAWPEALTLLNAQEKAHGRDNSLLIQRIRILAALRDQAGITLALKRLKPPLKPTQMLELLDLLPQSRWLPALTTLNTPADPVSQLIDALLAERSASPTAREKALNVYRVSEDLNSEQLYMLADLLLRHSDWPIAIAVIGQLRQQSPEALPPQVLQARLLAQIDQRSMGLSRLEQLASRPQLSQSDRQLLAESFYQLGAWQQAKVLSESILATDPENPAALLLLGHTAREHGQTGLATRAYQQLLKQDPDAAEARFSLALVQRAENKRLQAAANFAAVADDPRLGVRARSLQALLFRQRMALSESLDYSPSLGIASNDFFLRGAYTSYWLADTRHALNLRLPSPLGDVDQPDWNLNLTLNDGLYIGQWSGWMDFNRFNASTSLQLPWRAGERLWFVRPSLSWNQSSILAQVESGRQIVSVSPGLLAGVDLLPNLRISGGGSLSLGEPDLLLGSFEQGSALLQLEYFPPDMRLGLSAGLRDFLLYDGEGHLQRVQSYPIGLLLDWEKPELIYRGRAEFSPIRGEFNDINLNLEQSLRWFFTPELSGIAGLEVHKYFNAVQRNQSVASLQAGIAWRLPWPQAIPLYLEARGRLNSFFDTSEPLRPGFLLLLRSEL